MKYRVRQWLVLQVNGKGSFELTMMSMWRQRVAYRGAYRKVGIRARAWRGSDRAAREIRGHVASEVAKVASSFLLALL